ncbi:MAG: Hsp70 family protein [Microlunatus sp.]
MVYRLAVDLGTAFTAAAVINGSDPTMVGLGNRSMQVPSVLFLADDSSFVVGENAERRGLSEPDRLVREFKRRFGDPVPLFVAGAAYSAESLMARLLRWVVDQTSTRQGELPAELMLTHPANWGPYKRELLDQVVALAGLGDAGYCTEPEAAAANYAARAKVSTGERLAVYDLGGGTFDACVLEKRDNGFAVIGTPDGIEHLGGADIDEAVSQLVLRALGSKLDDMDVEDLPTMIGLARLRRDCVEAKEALSTETDVTIPVTLPGLNTMVRINRAELESTMRAALLDTVTTLRRTLASAQTAPGDLSAIVLVGGSSQIPLVSELLQHEFAVPLNIDTHPKHDIALGAALLCRESAAEPTVIRPATTVPAALPAPEVTAVNLPEPTTDTPRRSGALPVVPERPGHRRRNILVAVVAALVVGISVVAGILVANSRSQNNTSSTPPAAPSIEVTGAPTFDELMSHIPSGYRNGCHELTDDLNGAAVKVGCDPPDQNINSITHWQYASAAAFNKAVDEEFGHQPTTSDCSEGPGEGPYSTELGDGRLRSGRLQCHDSDGIVTFISTTDQLRVITVVDTSPSSDWWYQPFKDVWAGNPLE